MSDLLTAATESMGIPQELVDRSASARATASGTTTEEVLAAWTGGAPVAAAVPVDTPADPAVPSEEGTDQQTTTDAPSREAAPREELSPVMVMEAPQTEEVVSAEPEMEPVDLRQRLRTSGRVGIWTGAVLGLFSFVIATAFWSQNATVAGEELRPVLVADASNVVIWVALASVLFGAIVASLARAAAGWVNPAMRLASSKSSTAWIGALIGLALGVGAGALLANGFGTPIEGSEGLVQLPVLPTFAIMLIGGALLGWLTTIATQFFGTPVAVDEEDTEELTVVKGRLRNAVGIPVVGLTLLLLLVLPFAWTLIESNHLTSGGGAIIAIVASSGILAFASLAGSKPNMRIGRGELLVAVVGIGVVIIIIFAVMSNLGGESHEEEPEAGAEAAIHLVLS